MVNITLEGDFNRLSFQLSIRYFREIMIIASYGLLGFTLTIMILFFKVCRKEFFADDIIKNEIESVDMHKVIRNYMMHARDDKRSDNNLEEVTWKN